MIDDILDAGINVWQPIETCPWGERDVLIRHQSGACDVWPAAHGRPRATTAVTPNHWAELPPPPGSTSPAALAVALDWAEEHNDYPVTLRQRIAGLVPRLNLVSPWLVITEDGRSEARFVLGPALGILAEIRQLGTVGQWRWSSALDQSQHYNSLAAARRGADERLRAAGYLLMD